jgi:hypothetical protein
MIGIEYYGAPDTGNYPSGQSGNGLTIPSSANKCATSTITGLNDFVLMQGDFDVFPNPSKGTITINTTESSFSSVEIFNSMGQLIYTNSLVLDEPLAIALQEVNAGIYFVRCSDKASGVFCVKKLVVEN